MDVKRECYLSANSTVRPRSETIKLSAVEAVRVSREDGSDFVRLELVIGGVSVVSKLIRPMQAAMLGDSLGYLSNDIARPTV